MSLLGKLKALLRGGGGDRPAGPSSDGPWTVGKIERDGVLHGLVRVRTERPTAPAARRFASTVTVEWAYAEDGLPSEAQVAAMGRFESLLEELEGQHELAFLVRVRTGFGNREWLFYAAERDRFLARLNALLAGHPAYPIEVFSAEDSEWHEWKSTMSELGVLNR